MDLEQLKAMLAKGEITQEQYQAELTKLGLSDGDEEKDKKDENKGLSEEDIKKMIQSAEDKIRGEYSKKLKDIQQQYDALKNEKLSDEEKLSLKEEELAEKTRAFEKQQIDFEFTRHLVSEKLPAELIDFVPGSDLDKRKENLQNLKNIIDTFVENRVAEKFKSQNLDVDKGKEGKGKTWETMTWDERIEFAKTNPEEASKYFK